MLRKHLKRHCVESIVSSACLHKTSHCLTVDLLSTSPVFQEPNTRAGGIEVSDVNAYAG